MGMTDKKDEDGTVVGPSIRTWVVVKFMFFSALMVATPTAVFFLSHYRYLDCMSPACMTTLCQNHDHQFRTFQSKLDTLQGFGP